MSSISEPYAAEGRWPPYSRFAPGFDEPVRALAQDRSPALVDERRA